MGDGCFIGLSWPWRKVVHGVPSREWAPHQLVGAEGSCGQLSGACVRGGGGVRDAGDPGGEGDVIGNISSTAWYAAVRGLFRRPEPFHRILIHHSTLSQSRRGSSMPLAKCILSQNVRRVRVCKRHLFPARDRKAPGRGGRSNFMAGVAIGAGVSFPVSC